VVIDSCTRPVFPEGRAATDQALHRAGVELVEAI
jgi:hypothetical protein